MGFLSLILITPVIGALIIAFIPPHKSLLIRRTTVGVSALVLILSFSLLLVFDASSPEFQLVELKPWNPELGSHYALAMDGLALPMVLLATLLSFIAILASYNMTDRPKGYNIAMLVLEFGVLGVFMAEDWALFYVFWELTLIPMFFLIDQWGGKRRQMASLNFVLYTMGGSVFMLVSLLIIYTSSSEHSTTIAAMTQAASQMPLDKQILVFLGLLIGFGVKVPIFPLHGWLPLAHVEAPSPVSILLSGILLKMGAYGLIRAIGMLPDAALALQPLLAGLALFSIVYGGLLAWRQSDLKAMIAYSSISHMGIVILGISALNEAGFLGATMQMIAHGLVAGSLFLLIGLLYERTHSREVADYSSLVQVMPKFALFTTLALLASIGLPGLVGFPAELHALIGSFERWGWWVLLVSLGVVISAAYAMRTIVRLFTGPVRPEMRALKDLHGTELASAGVLAFGIIALGLMPASALELFGAYVISLSAGFP
ncbi:complex I subunit 4 family protein [Nitrosococcus oceani]|uniref:complex I subunit 4 family protein n=1 Tax=Nitrosococcus oceani TaxID=1229 RepID=UPI0004E86193|nr:NADH-quinone oxidoreductase subunit M [Nitrosococcus oceani]KFI22980.1 oxidoreductase [Nitrosococcus oceani]